MTFSDPKVLERAAKLKALSTSSNEHEAANALAALHRLALRHKIETASLEDMCAKPESAVCDDKPVFRARRAPTWKIELLLVLSEFNGCCEYHLHGAAGTEYMLAGRPEDIDRVRFLWAQTVLVLSRLAAKRLRRQKGRSDWLLGAVKGIEDQLRLAHETERKANTALAVVDKRTTVAVEAIERLAGGSVRLDAPRRGRDAERFRDGLGVGHRLHLGVGKPIRG